MTEQIPSNPTLRKKLNRIAWVISAAVLLVVAFMRRIHFDTDIDFRFLPAVYSTLNALTAFILVAAFIAIKRRRIQTHQRLMTLAILSSFLFLLGYVVYHTTTPETPFGGEGWVRTVYFFLLITHVVLAAVIFPFILFTFIRGYTGFFKEHKALARWVFPLWLYVALTGPVLYFMIRPYYPQ